MLVTHHKNIFRNIKNTWFVTHILSIVTHSCFSKKNILFLHMVYNVDMIFFGNMTHYKITQNRNLNNHWKLYWLWEETIILLITWCIHNDTILERKCIYSYGGYMLSLYYIFEKDVYTIRHAMGAFGMAPTASGST